jgi:hypothetical protein
MSNQDHKMLDEFPNEEVAETTDIARTKIERMLLKKYGKNLSEFRVYRHHKYPYLVTAKLKDGTHKTLALR